MDVLSTLTTLKSIKGYNFDINTVINPTIPTTSISAGGSVDTGDHWYAVTYVTATGETSSVATASVATTTGGNNTVTVTIPVSTDPRVTSRKIYRTKAGAAVYLDYFLATVANNSATAYVDTAADSSLTGISGASFYRTNTTSTYISVNGTKSLTVDVMGTYLGISAGNAVNGGGRNVFIGNTACLLGTTVSDSVFVGHNAGGNAINTGGSNVGVGTYSARSITSGTGNIGIGYFTGSSITTGINNTFMGTNAGNNASQLISATNSMALGNGTYTTASNQIIIGNTSTVNVGIGILGANTSALLHLKAGTAGAGTAPLKLTSGTNLGTTEAGTIEYDGVHLYFTAVNSGTRYQLDQQSSSASPVIVNQTTSTYSVTATNGTLLILCDTTSNTIAITLPTAIGNTATIIIKKINSSANNVTTGTSLSQTIDLGATAVLKVQNASITLISDNANWQII